MIKTAPTLVRMLMRVMSFFTGKNIVGWTSLWGVAYIAPGYEDNKVLVAHELTHIEQMKRDGRIIFLFNYCWWTLRFGYWNNPYEIEARERAQGKASR